MNKYETNQKYKKRALKRTLDSTKSHSLYFWQSSNETLEEAFSKALKKKKEYNLKFARMLENGFHAGTQNATKSFRQSYNRRFRAQNKQIMRERDCDNWDFIPFKQNVNWDWF